MKSVRIHEAKTHFSQLIKDVEAGEVVIVHRGSKPVARIVSVVGADRTPGALTGEIHAGDDFKAVPPGFEDYRG